MMEHYSSYADLQQVEKEGKDYRIHVRQGTSNIAVMAPHGGGIEPGTFEIADALAGSEHYFYCFEGIKKSRNFRLHLTSTQFDEDRGVGVAQAVQIVVAIHGSSENEEVVYLGGLQTSLKQQIHNRLTEAGFVVKESPGPLCRVAIRQTSATGGRARRACNWKSRGA